MRSPAPKRGVSIAAVVIAGVIVGFLAMSLSSFINWTVKSSQEISQDVDLDIFKSAVFGALNSQTPLTHAIQSSSGTATNFPAPAADGPLPTAVPFDQLAIVFGVYATGDDLGGGLKLSATSIVASYAQGTATVDAVTYNKYLVDVKFEFTREAKRSTGAVPQPWVLTVPIWVSQTSPFAIERTGYEASNGALTGALPPDSADNLTADGTIGAACTPAGALQPVVERVIPGSDKYKFCGVRGFYMDPEPVLPDNAVDLYEYGISQHDGFFWTYFRGHLSTGPQAHGDPNYLHNVGSYGSCDVPPHDVTIYYTCVK